MKNRETAHRSDWLQAVFVQFEAPLVRYAARLVGDADCGRDIVQDAFVRLCHERSQQVQDHVAAWLYTVCRNRALDVLKKEQRMSSLSSAAHENSANDVTDPAVAAACQESVDQALALLGRLPENQREVIHLKIEHGLSYRQISEVTGLSVSNVGYLLHQGLQTMRRRLTPNAAR